MDNKVFSKGIFFDEEAHTYTNEFGEKYVSGTKFVSLFFEEYDSNFWLKYKAAEIVLKKDKTLLSDEQISFLNDSKTKNGKTVTNETVNIFDFYKRVFLCSNNKDWFLRRLEEHPLFDEIIEQTFEIRKEWDEKSLSSTVKGTAYHKSEENKTILEENSVSVMGEDLSFPFLCGKAFPELNLYNHKTKLAGTADKVRISKSGDGYILDYKTSKTLDFQSFSSPYSGKGKIWLDAFGVEVIYDSSRVMKSPISHLDNCNYIHYALQLNLYSWFLRELGYDVTKRVLHKVSFDTTDYTSPKEVKELIIPNMEIEIEKMVDFYMLNKEELLCRKK